MDFRQRAVDAGRHVDPEPRDRQLQRRRPTADADRELAVGQHLAGRGRRREHLVPRRQPHRPHGRGALGQRDDQLARRDRGRARVHGHEHR